MSEQAIPLDPIEPTQIAPGVAAIPLTPTPWDDLPDGQHAVTPDGCVWLRNDGLWSMDPWYQHESAEQIIAVCNDPDEWAYGLDWTRKQVEDARGPLTPIRLPGRHALTDALARLAAVEALTWDPATRDAVSGKVTPPRRKTHVRVRDLDHALAPTPHPRPSEDRHDERSDRGQ